ncbi:type 1 glutamine amidotransferase [Paeniglutamicibacter sp. R2-26]|uniref:type 1 glutamine amidotransferase n=1 Tax=Paeniglutamicibacter sp. R2-26 TaxID=3144417 RepID=UPI003EE5FC40
MEPNNEDAGLRVLVVEHERTADAALVGEQLTAAGVDYTVVGPEIGVRVPGSLDGFDGLVVLGGSPGPMEDELAPWLPGVRELIAQALEERTPYLGICLGAQMLAHVAGGNVETMESGPEVGVVEMQLTEAGRRDELLGGLDGDLSALQWHWLEVVSLPAGSVSLCSSEACANQAFKVGPNAWGVQFHMEAVTRTARQWCDESVERLAELQIDPETEIIERFEDLEPSLKSRWSLVTNRWIDVVRENSRVLA